ncbi:LytR C-terminal domain-containing protein [uncultured Corynebacterium sp.]|uniref:LytR C-terminal domain-containing protein n=1 Tax=uncultured Corynebacterium sp. TaxID=159447 RepID=UPI0025E2398E|nr:LytR C-terminal domain-containing protein [uncultured Corynebacterium sp.]
MTNETQETQPAPSTLPLRGLAMILIAVAVMLGLWALYAFTQDDGADTTASPAATQAAPGGAEGQSGQAGQQGQAPATGGAAGSTGAAGAAAQGGTDSAAADASAPADGAAGASADANASGAAAPGADAAGAASASGEVKLVNVLNNSTVQGLAAEKAQEIAADGYQLGEVGNFADEVLTQTTVFYPAGDADAEASARELADALGGVAAENIPALPQAATAQRSLTVVLVNQ